MIVLWLMHDMRLLLRLLLLLLLLLQQRCLWLLLRLVRRNGDLCLLHLLIRYIGHLGIHMWRRRRTLLMALRGMRHMTMVSCLRQRAMCLVQSMNMRRMNIVNHFLGDYFCCRCDERYSAKMANQKRKTNFKVLPSIFVVHRKLWEKCKKEILFEVVEWGKNVSTIK